MCRSPCKTPAFRGAISDSPIVARIRDGYTPFQRPETDIHRKPVRLVIVDLHIPAPTLSSVGTFGEGVWLRKQVPRSGWETAHHRASSPGWAHSRWMRLPRVFDEA
jgi:hypothetical protein